MGAIFPYVAIRPDRLGVRVVCWARRERLLGFIECFGKASPWDDSSLSAPMLKPSGTVWDDGSGVGIGGFSLRSCRPSRELGWTSGSDLKDEEISGVKDRRVWFFRLLAIATAVRLYRF